MIYDELTKKKKEELWKQVEFYRTHLDIFIMEYGGIKLKPVQQGIAREIGNKSEIAIVQSRGFGKTWEMAICMWAMCVLYPGTLVAIVSSTAEKAKLVLDKMETYFLNYENIKREIKPTSTGKYISSTKVKAICEFHNGSKIESFSMTGIVGERAKIVVVDEAPLVKRSDVENSASPTRNYRRPVCQDTGLQDYKSKIIYMTSACPKSNPFFDAFKQTLIEMGNGSPEHFACALDYKAAIYSGISDRDFFEAERKRLTQSAFDMQYGSIFIGEAEDSVFPFNLTETCRTLWMVELRQPKHSKSEYIISLDIATSSKKTADNSVISVLKLAERDDGRIISMLVNMKSYHGKKLDFLANEIRKYLVRFPNTSQVIFDANGLGDSIPEFLNTPWIDPDTGIEHEPLVVNERGIRRDNVNPILYPFKANNQLNNQLVSCLRYALENKSIVLPLDSNSIYRGKIATDDEGSISREERKLTLEEQYIFIEADALQIELGNIVERRTSSNNYIYDTAKVGQHKDRYSSVAMGIWYISQLERTNKEKAINNAYSLCLGVVDFI